MSKDLVSILTPCYNGEEYLARYFQSVLNQTYPHIELVFIDDGSCDGSKKIIEKYKGLLESKHIRFIYEYQKNAGQAAAVNRGLKLVTGDFLMLMDADDEITTTFLETRVRFLKKHDEFVYCYGKAIAVEENNPDKIIAAYCKRENCRRYSFFEDLIFVKNIFFSGYMIKMCAIDNVIPRRDIYTGQGGQNAQILLPLAWYYGEPGYVEESYYIYHVRESSHSHSLNCSEKIIRQLYDYENILLNTLERIEDPESKKYYMTIKRHYAKLRFGNAVDTKISTLISKQYNELRKVEAIKFRDSALYIKYTNRVFRKIFHIR